ncbi:hypothetical protein [Paenisporosarcina antarctica]|uniref:Uncharacterized protein n=1 Tax=Paenisporosarcina antarctica TaxID=417367 RepID=A0A4P6ZUF1_9BACL|nr:hypothetical protein [Paenisporosarcina antarctica]QBP39714.1 hypothetical protein E2636_00415 [Paenisporosarcina antarctica]
MEDKIVKRAIESAGCWFVGYYAAQVFDNYNRLETDRMYKKIFIQNIFEKDQRDRTIGGTGTRVNSLMKIVRMNKVPEAMKYLIQSKRLNHEDPKAVEMAKDMIRKLNL